MINGADVSKIGYKGNDSLCADFWGEDFLL